jgi:hypothetical protein
MCLCRAKNDPGKMRVAALSVRCPVDMHRASVMMTARVPVRELALGRHIRVVMQERALICKCQGFARASPLGLAPRLAILVLVLTCTFLHRVPTLMFGADLAVPMSGSELI